MPGCGRRSSTKSLLLTNSFRTAGMAWLSGARERVGYRGELRSLLLTRRFAHAHSNPATGLPLATLDAYLHLTTGDRLPAGFARMELATTEADEAAADRVWQRLRLPAGRDVVVFNTGGAFGSAKNWPAEHFAELAQRIAADWDLSVLVNCGPKERETAREIVRRAGDPRVVSLADEAELPIGLTKACIRRSRMLVTTDSGPRYLGIAFERPVVTLFGPTDPRLVETHYERETCLSLALDCQPCMERVVPAGASSLHAGSVGRRGVRRGGEASVRAGAAEHAAVVTLSINRPLMDDRRLLHDCGRD